MSELEPVIQETRAFLAEGPPPDLCGPVMREIAALDPLPAPPTPRLSARVRQFLWAPRQVSIRPAAALAAASAVVVLVLLPYATRPQRADASADGVQAPSPVFVQFRLEAMASRVQLAGSFTHWEPRYELREAAPGIWSITVPLTEGVHDYAFVVDGQRWVADPYAPQIGDGFGGMNNRLSLVTPDVPTL